MSTWTRADILPADHPTDTHPIPVAFPPPLRLLRALSGPSEPPPVFIQFLTLADVADRAMTVEWV
jgi:hypothetical protein